MLFTAARYSLPLLVAVTLLAPACAKVGAGGRQPPRNRRLVMMVPKSDTTAGRPATPHGILYGGLTTSNTSGAVYELTPVVPRSSDSSTASFRKAGILASPAQFSTTSTSLKSLAERHVVLMVDRSASMNTRDCPGQLSRWQWCSRQISQLSAQLSGLSADGVCVVPFNGSFQIFDHQNAPGVVQIFKQFKPSGQTRLAPALHSQLVTQLARHWGGGEVRPLLIAVITDGEIRDASAVREAIEDSTGKLQSADEIKIVLLRVGDKEIGPDCFFDYDGGTAFRMVESCRLDTATGELGVKLAQCLAH